MEAQNKEIFYLHRSNQIQKSVNIKLNGVENQIEKNSVVKELKAKVKSWKKSLGTERAARIKLEKKIKSFQDLAQKMLPPYC